MSVATVARAAVVGGHPPLANVVGKGADRWWLLDDSSNIKGCGRGAD